MARAGERGLARATRGLLAAAAVFLGVAGCAPPDGVWQELGDDAAAVAQPQGCVVERLADVPFGYEVDSLMMPLRMGEREARLELDTGLSAPLAMDRSPAINARFGLQPRPSDLIATLASGSRQRQDLAFVDRVSIGDWVASNVPVLVPASEAAFNPALRGDGTVGLGLLGHLEIEIDPEARRLRLFAARGCDRGFVPFAEPYAALPMDRGAFGLFHVMVAVDGRALEAVIDTGSNLTHLSRLGAERVGLTAGRLARDPYVETGFSDASGEVFGLWVHTFRSFQLGDMLFADVILPVTDAPGPFDATIGTDLLLAQRILVSPATATLYVSRDWQGPP